MTRITGRLWVALLLCTGPLLGNPPPSQKAPEPARKVREVRISMRDGLRFDPARFTAVPGERLRLRIENSDTTDLAHNLLVVAPGSREAVNDAALQLAAESAGEKLVPGSGVIAATSLMHNGEVSYLEVNLPPGPGIYPYVCTFPGHGAVMYGAIYAGVPMPELEADRNIPEQALASAIAGRGRRPFVQRIFMPGAGPAAIAVALPGDQNYCWDAGECRLRYVWRGRFVDGSEHWGGNGMALARVAGSPWWRSGGGRFPLRIGRVGEERPATRFRGYSWEEGLPVFHYEVDGVRVDERIAAREDQPGLELRLTVHADAVPVFYDVRGESDVEWSSSHGRWEEGILVLRPGEARTFTVTIEPKRCGGAVTAK